MQDGEWSALVVERLRQHRRDGVECFDEAWAWTLRLYPPRGKDAGPVVMALFDERGREPETFVPWFRRVCEAAWLDVVGPVGAGDGPALRHFTPEMLAGAKLGPEPLAVAA